MILAAYFDLLVFTLKVVTTCTIALIFIVYWIEEKMDNKKTFQTTSNTPDTPANHTQEVT